jgi:predicted small lipoprotein YifL
MELRMLRRSVTALLVAAAVGMAMGCGIKGPLKLPPAKPGAPETPAAPPPVRMGDEVPDRIVPDVQPDGGK